LTNGHGDVKIQGRAHIEIPTLQVRTFTKTYSQDHIFKTAPRGAFSPENLPPLAEEEP
jgi:hypothetical protein